jgi:GNAT superfamily N-acetyltransferase
MPEDAGDHGRLLDCRDELQLPATVRAALDVDIEQYTLDWLVQRVRWHLDARHCIGAVFVAVEANECISGHAIVRVERDDAGQCFGLFSTTYVDPASRRRGIATALLTHGLQWMQAQGMSASATWTAASNLKLIALYQKHGYQVTQRHRHDVTNSEMVRLSKSPLA